MGRKILNTFGFCVFHGGDVKYSTLVKQFIASRPDHMCRMDFSYKILRDINFSYQNLYGSRFYKAKIINCNFTDVDLQRSYFEGATFDNVEGLIDLGQPYSWRVIAVRTKFGLCIHAGCRSFLLYNAEKYWKNRTDRKKMMPLLAKAEKIAIKKGWRL